MKSSEASTYKDGHDPAARAVLTLYSGLLFVVPSSQRQEAGGVQGSGFPTVKKTGNAVGKNKKPARKKGIKRPKKRVLTLLCRFNVSCLRYMYDTLVFVFSVKPQNQLFWARVTLTEAEKADFEFPGFPPIFGLLVFSF